MLGHRLWVPSSTTLGAAEFAVAGQVTSLVAEIALAGLWGFGFSWTRSSTPRVNRPPARLQCMWSWAS